MARKRSNGSETARGAANGKAASPHKPASAAKTNGARAWSHLFSDLACATARFAGKPTAFLTAAIVVIVWALTGPLFGYSDTWQLVINTSTTIVTFLMVFLIQHTQNRDTLALQAKLAELIIAMHGAKNKMATIEDLSEEELEELHESYRQNAEDTLHHLKHRRGELKRAG